MIAAAVLAVAAAGPSGASELHGAGVAAPAVGAASGKVKQAADARAPSNGYVHLVRRGDTLWDVADMYLGTPWVWPDIWRGNPDVANPHLIYPGDYLWVSASEIRRLTPEEAEALLADGSGGPAALAEDAGSGGSGPARSLRFSAREAMGMIGDMDGVTKIVGTPLERAYVASDDAVYIGLGRGSVQVGDQFTVFEQGEEIRDPETGRSFGHIVQVQGWLEVREVHEQSSTAHVRLAYEEIQVGASVVPRERIATDLEIGLASGPVEGSIAGMHRSRAMTGGNDVVYLNRGTAHGLEVGSALEVFRPQQVKGEGVPRVALPDFVVGRMVVLTAQPDRAVALVTSSKRDLVRGDRFRNAPEPAL